MTAQQEFLVLFSTSAVLTALLTVGIVLWGWPLWLLPAVFWVTGPAIAFFIDLHAQRKPGSDPRAQARRAHHPARSH